MTKKFTLLSILFAFYGYFYGQTPGTLDSTFGTGGKVTSNYFTSQTISDTVTQPDGKIIGVGVCRTSSSSPSNFYVVRFNSNGSIDTTFGSNGYFNIDMSGSGNSNSAETVELQPDGKIIVGGSIFISSGNAKFGVLRLNANGTIDTTFGNQGKSVFALSSSTSSSNGIKDIALQTDGKIIVAGTYYSNSNDFAIARLNVDGSLDTDFSNDGKVTIDFGGGTDKAYKIKILNDSRILVGGSASDNGAWCMLQPDGSLDSTFGTGGKKTFTTSSDFSFGSFYFLPNNSILIGGFDYVNDDAALYKVSLNGIADTTFGNNGKVVVDVDNSSFDYSIADLDIDSTGKIYAVGRTDTGGVSYFYLLNFNTNGTLNTSFSYDGKVLVNFGASNYGNSVSVQPNGKVLLAGSFGSTPTSALARFFNQSNLGTTETGAENTLNISPNPTTEFFIISKSDIIGKNQKVEILDETGRIIKTVLINTDNLKVQVSDLKSGVYYVHLNTVTKKLIIK